MSTTDIIGNASFEIEVPYKLIATGPKGVKPLIIYLHGYKQNRVYFEKRCRLLTSLHAYHLFLQGPYIVYDESHNRAVDQWGRAWYLYDGNQEQFIQSMEKTAVFIDSLIEKITNKRPVSKQAVLGYSMGGYLAGYYALSRPDNITELMVINGRIKTEHFVKQSYFNLHALALHGTNDESVAAKRQKESCGHLQKMGAQVTYRSMNGGHRLSLAYIEEVHQWLKAQGYEI